jgi:hypothetical protein
LNLFRCGYLVDLDYWALYSHSLLIRLSIVVVVPLVGILVVIGRLLWVGSFGASSITSVRRWCSSNVAWMLCFTVRLSGSPPPSRLSTWFCKIRRCVSKFFYLAYFVLPLVHGRKRWSRRSGGLTRRAVDDAMTRMV